MTIDELFAVAGRSAVVTGGASGLGLGMARALASNGAKVTILDRDAAAVERAVAELGQDARGAVADVTDRLALPATMAAAADRQGGLDIVIANAGISGGPGFGIPGSNGQRHPQGTIDGCSDEDWDAVIRVNLDGVRNTLRAAVPLMRAAGRGVKIIITSSGAALNNIPFISTAYHASKAALSHFGRQMAYELAAENIRVNMIAPVSFVTNIDGGWMQDENVQRMFAAVSPMKRVASLDEIEGVALFLASDASSYVTGAEIRIDGGALLGPAV